MIRAACLLSFLFLPIFLGCSNSEVAGGTVTSENAIVAGVILDKNGDPIENAQVYLLSKSFNPGVNRVPDSLVVLSDSDGRYSVSITEVGEYNVYAKHPVLNQSGILLNILVPVSFDTIIQSPDLLLEVPGLISFSMQELVFNLPGYIYLEGTPFYLNIDSTDLVYNKLLFENIPVETYSEIVYVSSVDNEALKLTRDSVIVVSGDTSFIDLYGTWLARFKIGINTTPTGMDVSETVLNFPLLVRLGSNVVQRSLASGKDLRVTKSDRRSAIGFEVEKWDESNGVAEIWVHMDTVYGTAAGQYFYLYVGNASANSKSNGPSVFDTSFHFSGVWHLNESVVGDSVQVIKDRSSNSYHGTTSGFTDTSTTLPGVIGEALHFDGYDDIIRIPNFPVGKSLSVSAWARSSISDPSWKHIVGRHPSWYLGADSSHGGIMRFSVNYIDVEVPFDTVSKIGITEWHHYVGVYDGNTVTTYFDGELLNSIPYSDSVRLEGNTCIGAYCNDAPGADKPYWQGDIDEVRVSNVARTSSWIKMSYRNQRAGYNGVTVEAD